MGKTKWSDQDATPLPRQEARPGGGANNRRRNTKPGLFVDQSVEAVPLPVLLRLILQRLRRNWVAFRYQFNRITLGTFKQQASFKIGLLALVAYLLLGPGDGLGGILTRDSVSEFVSSEDGVTLDVGAGDSPRSSGGKSLKIKSKNDAAPVGPSELFADQARAYVERYHDIARVEMFKYGIPASISLAQGLVESRAGTSKLARQNNNHFGMKCFARNCHKGHCSNFTDDTHKDFFRVYKSPWESWRAHSIMLSSGRYASLKNYGRDYRKWAYGLKRLGYATNATYAEKIIGMIEQFELHQYDQ